MRAAISVPVSYTTTRHKPETGVGGWKFWNSGLTSLSHFQLLKHPSSQVANPQQFHHLGTSGFLTMLFLPLLTSSPTRPHLSLLQSPHSWIKTSTEPIWGIQHYCGNQPSTLSKRCGSGEDPPPPGLWGRHTSVPQTNSHVTIEQ